MARLTKRDRDDFAAFCRNATDSQLENIERKEREARRIAYANIARAEIDRRAGK